MTASAAGDYAGEASVAETWEALASKPEATLVDVRTQAEWVYVGLPSLQSIDKAPVLAEWQSFPAMDVAPDFAERLTKQLEELGVGKDAPLYFICRSGARSRHAAIAMTRAGFTRCFNVSTGFEGPLDDERHRGAAAGWKAAGLPWTQS
jgi:rhodanese-related sulfurtransferase